MLITNQTRALSRELQNSLSKGSDLLIASGYVSPAGCEILDLPNLSRNMPVRLAVGRALADGLSPSTLNYLGQLHSTARGMGGGVVVGDPPFHSKIFSVGQGDSKRAVWLGSSNLTSEGLGSGREATVRLSGQDATDAHQEAEDLWAAGTPLPRASIRKVATSPRGTGATPGGPPPGNEEAEAEEAGPAPPYPAARGKPHFCIELAPDGTVPKKSGPNWWNGEGRERDPDECYVPLRAEKRDAAVQVFGTIDPETQFEAITHDGQRLNMQLEGTASDPKRGKPVAKNISSRGEKKSFGKWLLRDTLGLKPRELLTMKKLAAYGRTELCFYRLGTNARSGLPIVYMDFSKP